MDVFSLLFFFVLLVFVFGILHILAVRRAKYLVEKELESSASNPFADVILATEPAQKLSTAENVSSSRNASEPYLDYASNASLSINPVLLGARQEHTSLH